MHKILETTLLMGGALGISQAVEAVEAPAKTAPVATTQQPAPNVIWILLDDVGFGASSAFGGLIETPNLDALAAQGLRYTNFHTTAISSPTRAALLTGRNHHSVSMGLFPETANDQPGYQAKIPASKGNIAEILHESGYSTYALGKWHLTPITEATQAGPFNRWPTGKGFDHYYGFLYGETDQWHPQLIEETHRVDSQTSGQHLNALLTNKAIQYISAEKSIHPDKPFFVYFAPGATHAPHQVAQPWIDKYKGKFDGGWDKYREQVFANQKKLGVIPQQALLPERNPNIKAWDTLNDNQKRLYARYFETYAGFFSYTDAEIGRLLEFLKKTGQFDNTIIAVLIGDNGASKEGTEYGTTIGLSARAKPDGDADKLVQKLDSIGTEYSSPNYPLGWAQAANTPFKYWKQDANSEGGTHNPLILSYPQGIQDKGGIRQQYAHVIDLLPTTLELAKVNQPKSIAGITQDSLEGTSLAYSISDAKATSRHKIQYYEINGSRSIYKEGWKAGTLHKPGTPFDKDTWELYNLNNDPTEINDLSTKEPGKLKELQALFTAEGKKYHVFPLKDTLFTDFLSYKGAFQNRQQIVLYPGIEQIFSLSAPDIITKAYSLNADVEIPTNGAEGVLIANGGRFGGSSLFVQNNKLNFAFSDGSQQTLISANKPISAGKAKLRVDYAPETNKNPQTASISLFVNDEKVAEGKIPLLPISGGIPYFAYDEGFDIGRDQQTPVSDTYQTPYSFTGNIEKVTIDYAKN
ncbi:arylsulfatase [Methylomonas sp. AM2-LC]|uniref:arylsulfatase n=1 Tax=Methylomonas sp. AM2-LC TaxID=3153301 RepID=UPI003265B505